MTDTNPLKATVTERMETLAMTRGQLGRRLSNRNPSKALRRLDDYLARGASPSSDFTARLAEALETSPDALEDAVVDHRTQQQAHAETRYRETFVAHAVWTTTRERPGSFAMAGLINAPARRVLRFPADLPDTEYVAYCRDNAPEGIPLYGHVTGFVINYHPDQAVRYDLEGERLETLAAAKRVGVAVASV
ncbi:hypothetical protein [Spiribacter vilamensis]|uniref:Uncharacterized protein n=1 Tax=Spiribacter vilamensis TaxID=531306 RepID=A0A4Q8D098_9GAMM|nr:hypothetical protein [Spiribacter vilamensis]RZU98729.1 hypothetical protein EV698_0990 [Spiribacter vilamensis]TVO62247.1 hypothetical protein FPL09_09260 [Spiribacter vilamensis]